MGYNMGYVCYQIREIVFWNINIYIIAKNKNNGKDIIKYDYKKAIQIWKYELTQEDRTNVTRINSKLIYTQNFILNIIYIMPHRLATHQTKKPW